MSRQRRFICDGTDKKCFVLGTMGILASLLLLTLAREIDGFGQWYASNVYPVWEGSAGRIFGLFPFSVVEFAIYGLTVAAAIYGVRHIKQPIRLLSRTCLLIGGMFLVYMLNCGINYSRIPFSSYLNLEVRESSKEELSRLCDYLTEQVNAYAEHAGGQEKIGTYNDQAVEAMKRLGDRYPQLSGYYPRPKPLCVSWILSVQQLCGIYSPFTIEANYNRDMTPYNIPHTLCHELSHLKGFMREDEANFIGYLACTGSQDPNFAYSGYLTGWIYATNALSKVDWEGYIKLYQKLDSRIVNDLQVNSDFWKQYDGKVAETAAKMNDTYLKMNAQADGVKSYGRVVDLMLAMHRQQNVVEESK